MPDYASVPRITLEAKIASMPATYIPAAASQLRRYFNVTPPDFDIGNEVAPGDMAPMIRMPQPGDRACEQAMFGIVPHWAEMKITSQTFSLRSEAPEGKPVFRNAYKRGRFCLIPAECFFEASYEHGTRKVRYEIAHADGSPLAMAGLWEFRPATDVAGALLSMSMFTINADEHPLMRRFGRPEDEKRMPVLVDASRYDDWLQCPVEEAPAFFRQYPADRLIARPSPKAKRKQGQPSLPFI